MPPEAEGPRGGNAGAGGTEGDVREPEPDARAGDAGRDGVRSLRILAGVAFLGVQVVVPARGLFSDGQDRWSWEMFSRPVREAQVEVRYPDRVTYRSLRDVLVVSRHEIGPDARLAGDLCRHHRGATRVRVDTVARACDRR